MSQVLPSISPLNSHWQKITFIAALCERHQSNFLLFCEANEIASNGHTYNKLLNKLWEYLAGQLKSTKNLEKTLLELEAITPEPHDDDGYGVYPALDACLLLISAVQMVLDDSIDDTQTAQQLSAATVTQFIAIMEGRDFDPTQQTHSLYEDELATHQHAIDMITGRTAKAEIVKNLRKWFRSFDSSNLGIAQ